MAADLDNFPTYDPVIKQGSIYMSNIWKDFLSTFMQSLQGYLSQNGIFIPRLTTAQRDAITTPQEGQMIYLTDAVIAGVLRTAELQIWLVTINVGAWVTIV